jgi:hypothetical protein
MSEFIDNRAQRREELKAIIKLLHGGASVEEVKQRFADLIKGVDATEISELENELIAEGMPVDEVKRLCDVHVTLFEEGLAAKGLEDEPELEPGHPAHTIWRENRILDNLLDQLDGKLEVLADANALTPELIASLTPMMEKLGELNKHYLRKENQLFPFLEKHGILGPTQVMWGIHDDVRGYLKAAKQALTTGNLKEFIAQAKEFSEAAFSMITKEEQVLLPMSMEALSEAEWAAVLHGSGELGYAWHRPVIIWEPDISEPLPDTPTGSYGEAADSASSAGSLDAVLPLSVGGLTLEQINLLLTNLPVDVTYVDENDRVRYYSAGRERVFPRSPAIIGREVAKCHPPSSVHIVEKIVQAFKNGEKDVAEFWIPMGESFVHIRYFALRDDEGNYRGVIEVSQDVSGIRALEGERRLLDW